MTDTVADQKTTTGITVAEGDGLPEIAGREMPFVAVAPAVEHHL